MADLDVHIDVLREVRRDPVREAAATKSEEREGVEHKKPRCMDKIEFVTEIVSDECACSGSCTSVAYVTAVVFGVCGILLLFIVGAAASAVDYCQIYACDENAQIMPFGVGFAAASSIIAAAIFASGANIISSMRSYASARDNYNWCNALIIDLNQPKNLEQLAGRFAANKLMRDFKFSMYTLPERWSRWERWYHIGAISGGIFIGAGVLLITRMTLTALVLLCVGSVLAFIFTFLIRAMYIDCEMKVKETYLAHKSLAENIQCDTMTIETAHNHLSGAAEAMNAQYYLCKKLVLASAV